MSLTAALAQTMMQWHSTFLKPILPAFFFFAGVTYDTLTLTRIDRLLDNLILLLYLTLLGTLIILTGRLQLGLVPSTPDISGWNVLSLVHRTRPHLAKALQFLLGGLFSAYAILYSQSASFSTTGIFLGIIVGFLIANEFLQSRYSSLKMLIGLFAIVTLSFMTFFLPVLTGWMNAFVFLTGAVITLVVVWKTVRLTLRGILNLPVRASMTICLPAFSLVGLCAVFYFLNWIPPIPLSLKSGGIYHQIDKQQDQYVLTYEDGPWYAVWKRSDDRVGTDAPVYSFSSVFAPVTLHTTIYHHWEWRPLAESAEFITTDRIPISITGGREHGYRLYTMKQRLQPGEWRVNVEAEDGRLIGRITFIAEANYSPSHDLRTITQ
ncbi:MAG: DUF2914 domain-containing protein [Nitrospirae bacterium CG_4_9_14_3_um_filter_51_5]|nr:MAG: DUF2914 domain-containing protein [Nitrospirae bacterium CG_4_9_14_3_um_filter_51_5]